MFIDRAQITVKAGGGGDGSAARFMAPFSRHPQDTGGNGGDGGDVLLLADPQLTTLLDFQFRHEFRAQRGGHGGNHNKTGARGDDTLVRVPVGTLVYDSQTSQLLRDLIRANERLLIAKGGEGGWGSANASRATPGKPGQERLLRFELKLIADVGLVGFPNAGKSSLLQQISTAKPKIASYPFTTITPVLGVVAVDKSRERAFVACDIPGLIEGAHEGRGLGIQFLRHVERTRLLIHVIDMGGLEGRDPVESYRLLNEELAAYSPVLATRPQLIAANKMDIPEAKANLARFRETVREPIYPMSCATREGVGELVEAAWQQVQKL